ncbi:MAG: hypothetical protein ACXAAI_01265 [Promethearchaeota archaeon]|jgi:hypothetical protein
MGYIKETADVIQETLKGVSNKRKFKKLIDNMIFAIETNTVSVYFLYKFKLLEELAPLIKLKVKRDKEYLDKYKTVKEYYNHHYKKRVLPL